MLHTWWYIIKQELYFRFTVVLCLYFYWSTLYSCSLVNYTPSRYENSISGNVSGNPHWHVKMTNFVAKINILTAWYRPSDVWLQLYNFTGKHEPEHELYIGHLVDGCSRWVKRWKFPNFCQKLCCYCDVTPLKVHVEWHWGHFQHVHVSEGNTGASTILNN